MNTSTSHAHNSHRKPIALAFAILATSCNAFTATTQRGASTVIMSMESKCNQSRRSVLSSLLTGAAAATVGASVLTPSSAFAEAETMERGGVGLTPFNSLAFNYREGESPTVDGSEISEDSIPYSDFLEKLSADKVTFVEFLAPNGDAAYATLKSSTVSEDGTTTETTSKPIRIGEGYPVEDPKGWSSPAFVVKAVAKKNVPYKFVVPGLGDTFKTI